MEVIQLLRDIAQDSTEAGLHRCYKIISAMPDSDYKTICYSYIWEHYSHLRKDKYCNNKNEYAVIYSPGHGAGWSTWLDEDDCPNAECDPQLVEAILNGENVIDVAKKIWNPDQYMGADDFEIEWVPFGARYEILEYDGHESVMMLD